MRRWPSSVPGGASDDSEFRFDVWISLSLGVHRHCRDDNNSGSEPGAGILTSEPAFPGRNVFHGTAAFKMDGDSTTAERMDRCYQMAGEAMQLARDAPPRLAEGYLRLAEEWLKLGMEIGAEARRAREG